MPTDYGPYAVLVAILGAAFTGIGIVIKWLDNRQQRDRLQDRAYYDAQIATLNLRVAHLENGQGRATSLIVQGLAFIPPDDPGRKLFEQAIEALHK